MKLQTFFFNYAILLLISSSIFSDVLYGQIDSDANMINIKQKDLLQKKGIKTPDDLLKGFEKLENEKKAENKPATLFPDENLTDHRLDSVKLDAWKNYYKYMSQGYKHRAHVFTWQLFSSIIIFCVVTFLVLIGIYFAWLQFKVAMKEREKVQEGQSENLTTEINVSSKEIKVSSPVLGIIILIISLLFFYLYLLYVYPIEEIF